MTQAEITFSETAKEQLQRLIAASDKDNLVMRVSVSGGGCSGFQYHFDFDQEVKTDDLAIKSGEEILGTVDETSYELLKNCEIDYVDELGGSYFKINNPNANSTCGCGSSFAV